MRGALSGGRVRRGWRGIAAVLSIFLLAGAAFQAAAQVFEMDGRRATGAGYRPVHTNFVHSLAYGATVNAPESLIILNQPQQSAIQALEASEAERRVNMVGVGNLFAEPLRVGYGSATAGSWVKTADGGQLWVLKLVSPGALGLRVNFPVFRLSPGIEVRIYNPSDPAEALGPFTGRGIFDQELLISPLLYGDTAVIEVYVPPFWTAADKEPLLDLEINGVGHIYEEITPATPGFGQQPRFCHRDPTCFEDYHDVRDATIMILILFPDNTIGQCSATLLNNTANRYLVLSAFHCYDPFIDIGAAGTLFLYEWQTTQCEVPPPLNISLLPQTFGAINLASNNTVNGNDMVFMEGAGAPPEVAFFLGWSTAERNFGDQVGGVHHPGGDYKALWRGYVIDPVVSGDQYLFSTNVWGRLDPGSSGSAIVDDRQRVLGQLFGGTIVDCEGGTDLWGRFSVTFPLIREDLLNETPPGPGPGEDDMFEENDTLQMAPEIGPGIYQLVMNDDDYFTVTVSALSSATIRIDYTPVIPGQELLDIDLYLLDTSGQVLAFSISRGIGVDQLTVNNNSFQDITLIVLCTLFSGSTGNSYVLTLTNVQDTETPPSDDGFEDNDTLGTAATITTGILSLASFDEDWFRIDVPAFNQLTARIDFDNSVLDLDLELYDIQGTLLRASRSPVNNFELIQYTSTVNAPYFIRVDRFQTAAGSNYTLLVDIVPDTSRFESFFRCFIVQQYRDFLQRVPSEGEIQYYLTQLLNGTLKLHYVVAYFIYSPEFADNNGFITRCYLGFMNNNMLVDYSDPNYRYPLYWELTAMNEHLRLHPDPHQARLDIIQAFLEWDQWQAITNGMNNSQFIDYLHQYVLGRPATAAAKLNYLNELDSGLKTWADLMLEFVNANEAVVYYRYQTAVVMAYLGLLDRDAERGGFNFYMQHLTNQSISPFTMLMGFVYSPEYINRLNQLGCTRPAELQ